MRGIAPWRAKIRAWRHKITNFFFNHQDFFKVKKKLQYFDRKTMSEKRTERNGKKYAKGFY